MRTRDKPGGMNAEFRAVLTCRVYVESSLDSTYEETLKAAVTTAEFMAKRALKDIPNVELVGIDAVQVVVEYKHGVR